jgi:hypothetical protein
MNAVNTTSIANVLEELNIGAEFDLRTIERRQAAEAAELARQHEIHNELEAAPNLNKLDKIPKSFQKPQLNMFDSVKINAAILKTSKEYNKVMATNEIKQYFEKLKVFDFVNGSKTILIMHFAGLINYLKSLINIRNLEIVEINKSRVKTEEKKAFEIMEINKNITNLNDTITYFNSKLIELKTQK